MLRPRSRPKFPRRRNPRRVLAVTLGVALAVFLAALISRCAGGSEPLDGAPPASAPVSQEAAASSGESGGLVMNLAGITAPRASAEAPAADTPKPPVPERKKDRTEESAPVTPPKGPGSSDPALPRSFSLDGQPPLFAAESNMWGQPFVGFGLDEISSILTERYKGVQPKEWGERGKGIVSRLGGKARQSGPVVALTLDACGGKKGESFDEGIINFLREKNIPATIFISSKWIASNRQAFIALSEDPLFEIAAHGVAHKPLSVNGRKAFGIKGTASIDEVVAEVEANAREIQRTTNKRPKWFRSGTAHYDDVAVNIVHDLGLGVAGFSITADEGATLPAQEVEKKILAAKPGDIIVCHMNQPQSGTREGLLSALPRLLDKGYVFLTLSAAAAVQE